MADYKINLDDYNNSYIDEVQLDMHNLRDDYHKARVRNDDSECEKIISSMFATIKNYRTYNENMLKAVNVISSSYSFLDAPKGLETITDLKIHFHETISKLEEMQDSISGLLKKTVN